MSVDYLIKPSKRRKTVSIVVQKGQVRVLVPSWLPTTEIDKLLQQKKHWIDAKLAEQQAKIAAEPSHSGLIDADLPLFLFGSAISLVVEVGAKKHTLFDAQQAQLTLVLSARILVKHQQKHLKAMLQAWFSQQLLDYLTRQLPIHADLMQQVYRKVTVKNYQAKWGSCNSRQELAFNWRLACMPTALIDSVIVHELAHLKYLDHSRRFWAFVAQFDPQYQQHKQGIIVFARQLCV